MHDEVFRYAVEVSNPDVRATLTWLDEGGFVLAESSGGREEAFGNVSLLFTGSAQVRVVHDRSQWDLAIGSAASGRLYGLAVLTAARDSAVWQYPALIPGELPTQLPPGLSWHEELPSVIEWLQQAGATDQADRVDAEARQAMRDRPGL
jgi:hypothetical protein